MSNYVLGHNDVGYLSTITGGVWRDELDEKMLARPLLTAVARTLDLTELVLDITLPEFIDIGVLGICNHNLSTSGSYQWEAFSDAGRTISVYDSGIITPYAYLKALHHNTTCDALTPVNTIYWRLTVNDSNSDGFIQIGRLFIGERFVTTCNMEYGLKLSIDTSSTQIEKSTVGIEAVVQAIKIRNATFTHSLIRYDVGREYFEFQLESGISEAILFEFDPENKDKGTKTFIGRNESLTPLNYPNFNINDIGFNIKEIL